MSTGDIGRFPDGRIFIKDGYQPSESKRGYQPQQKQASEPRPPRFQSGVVAPQGQRPIPPPDSNK
jgi:hypothetical protein